MINFWISSFLSKLALDSSNSLGPQVVLRSLSSPSSSCTGDPPPLGFSWDYSSLMGWDWIFASWFARALQCKTGKFSFQPAWIPSVTNWWCQSSADKIISFLLLIWLFKLTISAVLGVKLFIIHVISPSNSRWWSFSSSLPGIQFLGLGLLCRLMSLDMGTTIILQYIQMNFRAESHQLIQLTKFSNDLLL